MWVWALVKMLLWWWIELVVIDSKVGVVKGDGARERKMECVEIERPETRTLSASAYTLLKTS